MKASNLILRKALATSSMDSSEWSEVNAGIRDRAFFSATVEEERFLHTAREACAAIAEGRLSASEARTQLREVLKTTGMRNPKTGLRYVDDESEMSLTNLASKKRLDTILETNVRSARGYVQWKEGTSVGAMAAFPAQELVRVRRSRVPRDWAQRWKEAGGKLYGGRMIALKTDEIWTEISRFDHPWPPFDFNSGMGVKEISRKEAIKLGLIEEGEKMPLAVAKKVSEKGMNDTLQKEVRFSKSSPEWVRLKNTFGDQVQMEDGAIKWRGECVRDFFEQADEMLDATKPTQVDLGVTKTFQMKLGVPQKSLIQKTAHISSDIEQALLYQTQKGNGLEVTRNWVKKRRPDGSDHLAHFYPMTDYPDSPPLTSQDMELIPSIWRNPDRVVPADNDDCIVLECDGVNGDIYRLVISVLKGTKPREFPLIKTFYRTI